MADHFLQFLLQMADAGADQTAVHLQLFLSRTSRSDSAAKSGQGISKPRQPRCTISQLRQLDLQLSFTCHRMACKNIQDQKRPVTDLAVQLALQVVQLCRAQFIVADNTSRIRFPQHHPHLVQFSFSDVCPRVNFFTVLDY